jgi:hypothetical protein
VILFILFFHLGLTSLDPPENGIAINFGTTEFGSGNIQPTEPIQSAPQPTAGKQLPQVMTKYYHIEEQ